LDRAAYVEKVLSGNGEPATVQTPPGHTIFPGKTWGEVTPNIGKFHPVHPNLETSREYMQKALQEAGFASVEDLPEFELLTREDPSNPKLFTAYALSVLTEQVGLKVKLKQVTGPAFYDTFLEPALAFDMVVTGWNPDFDDPYTYMGYWVSSSKDMGATFDNAEFDALLDKANAETDPVKRADILVQAEALFSDIGPSVPFVHFKGTVVVQPWVKNLKTSVFGVPVNYVYVDIEK
jgi:oligopeptide transport system substrate-binding protein